MSYELERSLIETRFKAAMPSGAAIQFANTPFQPPSAGFSRLTVMSGGGSASVVSALFEDIAVLQYPPAAAAAVVLLVVVVIMIALILRTVDVRKELTR